VKIISAWSLEGDTRPPWLREIKGLGIDSDENRCSPKRKLEADDQGTGTCGDAFQLDTEGTLRFTNFRKMPDIQLILAEKARDLHHVRSSCPE
jgi:hypothetical protein